MRNVKAKSPWSGKRARRKLILEMAAKLHEDEGTLEIDSNAKISEGDDNGTYVAAWVWVPFKNTVLCKGDGPINGKGNDHDECDTGCPVFDAGGD